MGKIRRFLSVIALCATASLPLTVQAALGLAFSPSAATPDNHALVIHEGSLESAEQAALQQCARISGKSDCRLILSSDTPGFGALYGFCPAGEGCYATARTGFATLDEAKLAVDAECRRDYGVPACVRLADWEVESNQAAPVMRSRGAPVGAPNYKVVKVHYATDRKRNATSDPEATFGGERGTLSYGTCEVSIPRSHKPGELEAPSIWRLEFRPDRTRHVVLTAVDAQDQASFLSDLKKRVDMAKGRKVFVFIHGYNVSFANAARRTAQISYDLVNELGVDIAPLFYSWPSQASLSGYSIDEANIEWSQSNLKGFLKDLAENLGSDQIYVVAHSMGNRATTRAMAALLKDRPDLRQKFREIILMAPDVDAEVFKRDIAPDLIGSGRPVTLYASAKDKALIASKKVHGYPRLGEAGDSLTILKGMETIDASAVETDLLGHSYYAYPGSVLADVKEIIQGMGRAQNRSRLREVIEGIGRHWQLKP